MDIKNFSTLSEQEQTDLIAQLFEQGEDNSVCQLIEHAATHYGVQVVKGGENLVVLASQSPRRKFLMENILKVDYLAQKSTALEYQPVNWQHISTITKTIAVMKLLPFFKSGSLSGRVILTGDTLVHLENGTILSKPEGNSPAEQLADAFRILKSLLGKKQIVSSSIITFDAGQNQLHIGEDNAEVEFNEETPEILKLLKKYIELSAKKINGRGPLGKAGAYGIQEPEILSITKSIKGDPFVIIGLSIAETKKLLELSGVYTSELPNSPEELYKPIWGSEVWANAPYTVYGQAPANDDFVPMVMSKMR